VLKNKLVILRATVVILFYDRQPVIVMTLSMVTIYSRYCWRLQG